MRVKFFKYMLIMKYFMIILHFILVEDETKDKIKSGAKRAIKSKAAKTLIGAGVAAATATLLED